MSTLNKPAWLTNPLAFQEVAKHNLFLSPDTGSFTNLQDPTYFLQGMKQYLYWKGQLIPSLTPTTIFLAFIGPKGLVQPNVINVTKALKPICNLGQVVEFHTGANTNFLAISFKNTDAIQQISSNFIYFEDTVVLTVSQISAADHRFRLLWLPPLFNISRVHHLLNSFTLNHCLRRESIGIGDSTFSPTNVITGTLTLKPGQNVNDLPHLIKLPPPHKGCALLTIENRDPLCLKCRAIGHTRRQCIMVKCLKCSKVHFPDSPCGVSSYSSVASKSVTICSDDDWLRSLSDASLQEDTDNSLTGHTFPSCVPETNNPDAFGSTTSNSLIVIPDTSIPISVNINDSLTKMDPSKTPKSDIKCDHTLVVSSGSAISTSAGCDSKKLSPAPIANYTRSKSSSKVRITSRNVPPSQALRSELIPYSSFQASSHPVTKDSHLVSHHLTPGSIFGDPDFEHCFDSSSDSTQEEAMICDNFSGSLSNTIPRKRKGSSSSSLGESEPFSSAAPAPQDYTPPDFPSTVILDALNPTIVHDKMISSEPPLAHVSTQSNIEIKVSSLLCIDDAQLSQLRDSCPGRVITNEIMKALQLLSSHGIGFGQIISSPRVLKLKFAELKRKVNFLADHIGLFSIADICKQREFEDKIFVGGVVTPHGAFPVS